MASRNKKGRIHGIFKSAFQISFFHKPTMEETDIYYYIVLEDLILLKMRFLYDIVLIIDEVMPLSMTYLESQYEKLFTLLKEQTSVTVMVSLVGNTYAFKQACDKYDTPIVEREDFLDCSTTFYNKYKNYCRNDISRYGFYLISLREETFTLVKTNKMHMSESEPEVGVAPPPPPVIVKTEPSLPPVAPAQQEPEGEVQELSPWAKIFVTLWESMMGMETTYEINRVGNPIISSGKETQITLSINQGGTVIGIEMLTRMSTVDKMQFVDLLGQYGQQTQKTIRFNGVSDHDVIYNILSDNEEWTTDGPRTFLYTPHNK